MSVKVTDSAVGETAVALFCFGIKTDSKLKSKNIFCIPTYIITSNFDYV
jgi:hypothetical protein